MLSMLDRSASMSKAKSIMMRSCLDRLREVAVSATSLRVGRGREFGRRRFVEVTLSRTTAGNGWPLATVDIPANDASRRGGPELTPHHPLHR